MSMTYSEAEKAVGGVIEARVVAETAIDGDTFNFSLIPNLSLYDGWGATEDSWERDGEVIIEALQAISGSVFDSVDVDVPNYLDKRLGSFRDAITNTANTV